jgi:hypothetical protein
VSITKISSIGNWLISVDSVASDIPDQVGYFHRVPESWHWFQVGYIRPTADISDGSDISDPRSGSRTVAVRSGHIYPTSIGYT